MFKKEKDHEIIESVLYKTVAEFISANVSFSIVIDNHNNWSEIFPDRLKEKNQIILNIKEQALADSYVKDGKIIIIMLIDNIEYMKELEYCDLQAIMKNEKSMPYIVKGFVSYPEIKLNNKKNKYIPTDKDLVNSNNMWKKYNPELFKEN